MNDKLTALFGSLWTLKTKEEHSAASHTTEGSPGLRLQQQADSETRGSDTHHHGRCRPFSLGLSVVDSTQRWLKTSEDRKKESQRVRPQRVLTAQKYVQTFTVPK